MNSKVICFFAFLAVVHSAPQLYPAGVDPALCPGFPVCDNAKLHGVVAVPESPAAFVRSSQPAPVAQSWNQPATQQAWNAPVAKSWEQPATQQTWNAPVAKSWEQPAAQQVWSAPAQAPVAKVWSEQVQQTPTWTEPQAPAARTWNAPPAPVAAPAAPIFPPGVDARTCPNYPYCDVNAGSMAIVKVEPLPGFTERLYPAGVNVADCPKYPEC